MSDEIVAKLADGQKYCEVSIKELTPILVDDHTAGRLLGVCKRTIYELTKTGKLPCVRIGSRRLYLVKTIERFAQQCELYAAPAS